MTVPCVSRRERSARWARRRALLLLHLAGGTEWPGLQCRTSTARRLPRGSTRRGSLLRCDVHWTGTGETFGRLRGVGDVGERDYGAGSFQGLARRRARAAQRVTVADATEREIPMASGTARFRLRVQKQEQSMLGEEVVGPLVAPTTGARRPSRPPARMGLVYGW